MDDLYTFPAHRIMNMIRQEGLSIEKLVTNLLERINAINDEVNALVYYNSEDIITQAKKLDSAPSRDLPLFGLPISIKDNIEVKGMVSTGGVKSRQKFVPSVDATVVKRLRDAGAIILGKTNCPAFCAGFETQNEIYGRTNNPYDLEKTVGSSSGGEAALVASGGSFIGIGSDTGGSIKWPASYTGVCGLIPSFGRVPRTGTIPPYLGYLDTTQIGPLARTVKDLAMILPIIMGPDNWDPRCVPMNYDGPESQDLTGLNIAYYADNGFVEPQEDVRNVVYSAADSLADLDAAVQEKYPEASLEFLEVGRGLNSFSTGLDKETVPKVSEWSEPIELYPEAIFEFANSWLAESQEAQGKDAMLGVEFFFWGIKWDVYKSKILQFMNEYNAILCPVSAAPAFSHGESNKETFNPLDLLSYTHPYSLVGLPSVTLRGGTSSNGLPIGIQIITNHGKEGLALRIAMHLEEKLDGFTAPSI